MSSPLSVAAVIFIAVALSVVAQTPDSTLLNSTPPPIIPKELWRAGIYFGMSRNFYQADHIKGLPNVPSCCPDYTSGNGAGIGASVLAELPLSDQWRTGWRLSYASLDGQLRTEEFEEVNSNRGLVLATFEHTIAADITALGLESYVGYELFNNLKLFAGLRGDFLTGQGFRQEERLAAPEGITYENGSRIRMNYEGDIADAASLHVGVISMVRYELSISDNHDWVLAPEVGGWYGLTTLVKDLPWQVHGARVGISIQYIARDIPNLLADPVDLIVPIGSKPGEASGSERDKVEEKEGEK